jgi:MFS family permease
VIADRVDQRRLLSVTQMLGFLASLTLGILILSGRVEVWHVYIQVLIQSTIMAFDASVRHALFPRLVPKALIPEAVALSVIAGRVSKMVGPAIGGFSIAFWSEAAPFLFNAGSFLVLVAAVRAMGYVVPRRPAEGATIRSDLVAGLRYMVSNPVLSGLLKMELVFGIFQLNPVIITIIGRQTLDVTAEGLGGLLAAPALGALVGIGGVLVFGMTVRPGRFVVISSLVYASGLASLLFATSYPVTFGLLVVIGLFDSFLAVTRQSVMQVAAPGKMRGRIMANVGTVTRGFSPLAEAQSGFMIGLFGPAVAMSCAAGMIALNGITARLTNPTLWRFRYVHPGESSPTGVGASRGSSPEA